MYICIHKAGSSKELEPFFAPDKKEFLCDSNSILLDVRKWSHDEMLVPPYPETRIYKSIRSQLLKRYPDMKATFTIYKYVSGHTKGTELK